MHALTRRGWLRLAGLGTAAAGLFRASAVRGQDTDHSAATMEHAAHRMGPVGRVDPYVREQASERLP